SGPSAARNASSASNGNTPRRLARQCNGDQLADAVQKIHPLARMEMCRIAAADHEKADAGILAERQHRGGRDPVRVTVEQHGLLTVAKRAAARSGALNERRERLQLLILARERLHESRAGGVDAGAGEQHERGALRAEILAQARLDLLEPLRLPARPQEPQRKLMNLLDERVVRLRD